MIGVFWAAATNSSGEILAIREMALSWGDIIKRLMLCKNLYNIKNTDERPSLMASLIAVVCSNQRRLVNGPDGSKSAGMHGLSLLRINISFPILIFVVVKINPYLGLSFFCEASAGVVIGPLLKLSGIILYKSSWESLTAERQSKQLTHQYPCK